jgi:hypothetical protein
MDNSIFRKYTDEETFAKIVDYKNVTEMWEHSVKEYADCVALVDGKEYTYAVWTYTTLRDNESLRLCYAYGFEKTMPSPPSPNVTVTPP